MKYIITKTWVIDESEFTTLSDSEISKRKIALKCTKLKTPQIKIRIQDEHNTKN